MSTSLKIYLQILGKTSNLYSGVGLDIYKKKFKLNGFLIGVILDIIVYIIANGYSAYIYRNDFEKLMFCLITWALGFMVCLINHIITILIHKK